MRQQSASRRLIAVSSRVLDGFNQPSGDEVSRCQYLQVNGVSGQLFRQAMWHNTVLLNNVMENIIIIILWMAASQSLAPMWRVFLAEATTASSEHPSWKREGDEICHHCCHTCGQFPRLKEDRLRCRSCILQSTAGHTKKVASMLYVGPLTTAELRWAEDY